MKIGFSLSQCIADIVAGIVKIEDVMLITTSTQYPDKNSLLQQLRMYARSTDLTQWQDLADQLWDSGRIHQPRLITNDFRGIGGHGIVWMDIAPVKGVHTEAVVEAWETYRALSTLSA